MIAFGSKIAFVLWVVNVIALGSEIAFVLWVVNVIGSEGGIALPIWIFTHDRFWMLWLCFFMEDYGVAQSENKSEVARLRQQIADEYEAAERGLTGVAITGRHDFIQARMEGVGRCCEQLTELVGETEAIETIIEINDEAVARYQTERDREMQEALVKQASVLTSLMGFRATGMELEALSYALFHYFRCVDTPEASREEREMALSLRQLYGRLMSDLGEMPGSSE